MDHRLLLIGLISLSTTSPAEYVCPATPPIEAFLCTANEEYYTLQLIGEVSVLTAAPVVGTEGSIEEAKQRLKPVLAKAKNAVFFNTKAGDALNEFYVHWLTFIDDARPWPHEDLIAYQRRAHERYTTLQEKANHLRIVFE